MTITKVEFHWFTAWGNAYHTVEVNIVPHYVIAQTSLYGATGEGSQFTGIKSCRKRLSNGSDKVLDFGEWLSWPPAVIETLSSVTFAIATGSDQEAWLAGRIEYWG